MIFSFLIQNICLQYYAKNYTDVDPCDMFLILYPIYLLDLTFYKAAFIFSLSLYFMLILVCFSQYFQDCKWSSVGQVENKKS